MPSTTNPFIRVVNGMNGLPQRPLAQTPMTFRQKLYRKRMAALTVTMHQVLEQVGALLEPGETLVNMLPMTNEANSAAATDGLMGMYGVKTEQARDYVTTQASLRGNRLMVFTDRRIIFFIVIEFLDDSQAYYSYPYSALDWVMLRADPAPGAAGQAMINPYTLDFETADRHVFTEFLTPENAQMFKENLLRIPAMANIRLSDHVHRRRRWDQFASNLDFQLAFASKGFWLLLVFFILVAIWGYLAH
ncbi:hypothetical protein [Lacticaseibacillus absianus]|uniref:hypothetical protein n=1 Tax=Lacticaseibacillus absianus TaxID=2729623 RepID=UPI0015CCF223|nr:hypothetical protein [Lacticaseibacillus absianus]